MKAQISKTTVDVPEIKAFVHYRVYMRDRIDQGDWQVLDYLECTQISENAEGGTKASFRYAAGRVVWPDKDDFATYQPLDLVGRILRVDLLPNVVAKPNKAGNKDQPGPLRTFYVRVSGIDQQPGSAAVTDAPVDQVIYAYGLEDDLDLVQINGAYIYDATSYAKAVHRPLTFNEKFGHGLSQVKNRSEIEVQARTIFGRSRTAHAFVGFRTVNAADEASNFEWSVRDILNYCFHFFVTELDVQLPWEYSESGNKLVAAMEKMIPAPFTAEGMTVKQVLNRLIRPERGLGWCFRYEQGKEISGDEIKPQLHIFPIHDAELKLGDAQIPANEDLMLLDTRTLGDVTLEVGRDQSTNYSEILVLGEPLLSCFSLSFADGTLTAGWTSEEETQYRAAWHDNTEDQPLARIDLDQYSNVYCEYHLPGNWNGYAKNGFNAESVLVNPKLSSDGVVENSVAAFNPWGKSFEDRLPIQRTPAKANSPLRGDYLEPMVMLAYATDESGLAYCQCDKTPGENTPIGFRNLQNEPGVRMHPHMPHVMAGSTDTVGFAVDYENSKVKSEYAYSQVICTVALRTDQRLFVLRSMNGDDAVPSGRRLVIQVPDAELWLVSKSTVVDGFGGEIVYFRSEKPQTKYGHYIVRDDTKRLQLIADAAKAWYGKTRRSMNLTFDRMALEYRLGMLVKGTVDSGASINTVLSQVVYNLDSQTVSIATQYREIDINDL